MTASSQLLPNGKPVNFGSSQPSAKQKPKRKQHPNHHRSKSANNNVKPKKIVNINHSNPNLNLDETDSDSVGTGSSYAGSSFHSSQPKLKDLPKPVFSGNSTNQQGTKVSFNDLLQSNNSNPKSANTSPLNTVVVPQPQMYPQPAYHNSYPPQFGFNPSLPIPPPQYQMYPGYQMPVYAPPPPQMFGYPQNGPVFGHPSQ